MPPVSLRSLRPIPVKLRNNNCPCRRTFLTTPPQTLTATRALPYARSAVYDLVADISSYPAFLPYCNHAKVLAWSKQDPAQRRWPARAELSVGWGQLQEQYVSRVYCIPDRVVEAVAGKAQTILKRGDLKIYEGVNDVTSSENHTDSGTGGDIFESLRTRWTLEDLKDDAGKGGTKVNLNIEFAFQNPLYAALSSAALPKIAATVIEAFEKRAKEVLGVPKSKEG